MKKKKLPHIQKSGFSVPKNYFEELESSIFEKIGVQDEVLKPAEQAFRVPDSYFSSLEDEIWNKIASKEQKESKVIHLKPNSKQFYAVVASVAAVVMVFFSIFNFEKEQSATLDTIELTAFENYIESGAIDFSDSEISAFLQNENNIADFDISHIENEEILDYFDEYSVNPSLLIE